MPEIGEPLCQKEELARPGDARSPVPRTMTADIEGPLGEGHVRGGTCTHGTPNR